MKLFPVLIIVALALASCEGALTRKLLHRHHSALQIVNGTDIDENSTTIVKEGWLKMGIRHLTSKSLYPDMPLLKYGKVPVPQGDPTTSQDPLSAKYDPESNAKNQANMEWRANTEYKNDTSSDIPSINSFYFRLSEHALYYAEGQKELVVLGSIDLNNVNFPQDSEEGPTCFTLLEQEKDEWDLCADSADDKQAWMCAINGLLGAPCGTAGAILVQEKVERQPMFVIPEPAPFCNEEWTYNNHGKDWDCKCHDGLWQSPIDIPAREDLPPVENNLLFHYHSQSVGPDGQPLKLVYEDNVLRIRGDFGTMIHDEVSGSGESVTQNVVTYKVTEVQIHTPSDHYLNGKQYPLEVQIIHKAISVGDAKKRAVFSILFERTPGAKNTFFEDVDVYDMPHPLNTEKTMVDTTLNLFNLWIEDVNTQPYRPFSHYVYTGSLTSPPCDEYSLMVVRADPVPISVATLDLLRGVFVPPDGTVVNDCGQEAGTVVDMNSYPNSEGNNRALQPLGNRQVYYYEGCETTPESPIVKGHVERVEVPLTKYFYVDGNEPSGLPGAFVVSEAEAKGIPPGGDSETATTDSSSSDSSTTSTTA